MKNVVFIIAIETDSRSKDQEYDWSVKSWKAWCDKNNVELFIMQDLLCPVDQMKLTWQRYYLFDLLDNEGIEYNQVCMVDADTIVHPDCPNFFEETENKLAAVINPVNEWIMRSIEVYQHYVFKDHNVVPFWEYYNAGMQIVNKNHKEFFNTMKSFYDNNKPTLLEIQNKIGLGSDQTPFNYLLRSNNIETKTMSYMYNMQDLPRKEICTEDLLFTKLGWIYHFNTWPKPTPGYWMKKTYKALYENK